MPDERGAGEEEKDPITTENDLFDKWNQSMAVLYAHAVFQTMFWLHFMCCRFVDLHSSDQQQNQLQPHQAPQKHKSQTIDQQQATTKSNHNSVKG